MKKLLKMAGGAVLVGGATGGAATQIEATTDLQAAVVTFVGALIGLIFTYMKSKTQE